METNFYVGQEVVAIKDHSQGHFKKGDEFVILGIKQGCCKVLLDVGFFVGVHIFHCTVCKSETIESNNVLFFSTSFSPKQQLSETTYNDVQEWIKQGKELSILN